MFYRINLQYLPSVRLADSVVIEPPYVHRRRKADEYIVYLIKKGVMYLEENGETVTLQPGDMYAVSYTHLDVYKRQQLGRYDRVFPLCKRSLSRYYPLGF